MAHPGFWGDTPEGARQLVHSGQVDYLVMDYLAEITMSLLARAKAKDPTLGYPADFVSQFIAPYAKEIAARGIKVVCNAGGVNPLACRDAVAKELAAQGIDLKVAAVIGDDILSQIDELRAEGIKEVQSGAPAAAQDRHRQRLYRRLPDRGRARRRGRHRGDRPRRRQRAGAGGR